MSEKLSDPLCARCDYGPLHDTKPCATDPDCPCYNSDPEEYAEYVGEEADHEA